MTESCSLSKYDSLGAIYLPGQLIIWAQVTTSHPLIKAKIKANHRFIYPPQYDLWTCTEGMIPMIYLPNTQKVIGQFLVGKPQEDYVPVVTADGVIKVPLLAPEFKLDPTKLQALGLDGKSDGTKTEGVPGIFRLPISLAKVFKTGRSEEFEVLQDIDKLKVVRATGYSNSYSFTEAFQDAINNLPPDDSGEVDKLITINVDGIGAQRGGFVGFDRMFVNVSAVY